MFLISALFQAVRFCVYIAVLGDFGGDKSLKSETELKVICNKTFQINQLLQMQDSI